MTDLVESILYYGVATVIFIAALKFFLWFSGLFISLFEWIDKKVVSRFFPEDK